MIMNSNYLSVLAPWAALAVTLLVWLLNRSAGRHDKRDEKALVLEANYLAAHQQVLAEQTQLLNAEKSEHAILKTRFAALQSDHLRLQSAANEVILKYNLVRNLNPGDPRFPSIDVLPPVRTGAAESGDRTGQPAAAVSDGSAAPHQESTSQP